ncbi:hypothetical protein BDQ12DRAFT_402054 [Crucibulum laeve]|uniref:Uncharacterized protein n=1 Tax=Crucibulum laeve TaxID=68775 RepID=A0A5C3LLK7_9AGAR|nr:hypothetical protein BDQ12DRAFT_402054 [Crucibulum laeve]
MEHALLVAERLKHADTTPQLATSTIAYPSLIRQVFRSNDTRNEELTRENELKEKDREIEELKRKLEQEKATHRRTDGKLRLLKEEFEDLSDTCDAKIRELKTLENMLEKERAAHARTRNKMQAAEDDLRRASAFSTVRNTRRSTIGLGDQSLRSTDDTKILNTSKPSPSFSSYNDFSTADFAQSSHAALDSRRGRVLPLKLKQTSVKPLSTIAKLCGWEMTFSIGVDRVLSALQCPNALPPTNITLLTCQVQINTRRSIAALSATSPAPRGLLGKR